MTSVSSLTVAVVLLAGLWLHSTAGVPIVLSIPYHLMKNALTGAPANNSLSFMTTMRLMGNTTLEVMKPYDAVRMFSPAYRIMGKIQEAAWTAISNSLPKE